MERFLKDMDIIARLADAPNDENGLSAAELKARFDEGGKAIQQYLNTTVAAAVESCLPEPESEGTAGQFLMTDGNGTRRWATPMGNGDMQQSVYDPDGDGIVLSAESAAYAATAGEAVTLSATLPPERGGTGCGDLVSAAAGLLSSLPEGSTVPQESDSYAGAFSGSAGRRTHAGLWEFIRSRIAEVLGLSSSGYSGTAAAAQKLKTSRKICGAAFDGSADITAAQMSGLATLDSSSHVTPSQSESALSSDITADRTVTAADAGKLLKVNSSADVTVTVPLLHNGAELEVLRWGKGKVTIATGGSFYLRHGGSSSQSIQIAEQYGVVALKQITSSSLLAVGDIA